MVALTACTFECEGCGVRVVAFGLAVPPESGFCSQCDWLDRAWQRNGVALPTKHGERVVIAPK